MGATAIGAGMLGGSLLGAGAQTNAANTAANTQLQLGNQSIGAQETEAQLSRDAAQNYAQMGSQYLQNNLSATTQQLSPYSQFGQNNLGTYQSLLTPGSGAQNALNQTPGYQFALQQGMRGVQNSAAARGLGLSGAALAGVSQFNQGLASQNYQSILGNYQNASQLGYNAATGIGNANQQTGQGVANAFSAAGGATVGANTAAGQGIGQTYNTVGSGVAQTQASLGNALAAAYGQGANGLGLAATGNLFGQNGSTGSSGLYGNNSGPAGGTG